MASIFQGFDRTYHRCSHRDETSIHALRDCSKASAVLSFYGLDGCLLESNCESCIDWLEDATCLLDLKVFENLIMVLWNIWNNRNNALFRGKKDDARMVWEQVRTLRNEFRIFNLTHAPINPKPSRTYRWIKSPNDFVKINVDAAIVVSAVGIGVIAWDCDDFVLGGRAIYMDYNMDVDWAEAEALREGII
ncbi:uncharacterized protein LOC108455070 [Gossypium arboreum]|uniref:uncharacterized protein LOC108455070 n=1 Tax=Gossypium arboreum TaxID=29729 RepID=UPI0008194783|nr:uncharacterized protein LOC108455070 [Gossypium arboreum]